MSAVLRTTLGHRSTRTTWTDDGMNADILNSIGTLFNAQAMRRELSTKCPPLCPTRLAKPSSATSALHETGAGPLIGHEPAMSERGGKFWLRLVQKRGQAQRADLSS